LGWRLSGRARILARNSSPIMVRFGGKSLVILLLGAVEVAADDSNDQVAQAFRSHTRISQYTDFPYNSLLAHTTSFCYKKLVNDTNCCIDRDFAHGVTGQTIHREGTEWNCGPSCGDSQRGKRGADVMWLPEGADCSTPRILYIHGGSWMYGSPTGLGYDNLASKLVIKTGAIVMVPDYPLIPYANYTTMLETAVKALVWLANNGPDGCGPEHEVPLFVAGDSAGGGTALSLALALNKNPSLLPGKSLAGCFFFSPWTNLKCNTPDYYTNAFASIVDDKTFVQSSGKVYVGDIIFHGHPNEDSGGFQLNAEAYVGNWQLLEDPIASPLFADEAELTNPALPPMYFVVGASESILGDSILVSQKIASYGHTVHVDVFEGMWHVFPMYSEGCGFGQELWPAIHALNRTGEWVKFVVSTWKLPRERSNGLPIIGWVYDQSLEIRDQWFSYLAPRRFTRPGLLCAAPGEAAPLLPHVLATAKELSSSQDWPLLITALLLGALTTLAVQATVYCTCRQRHMALPAATVPLIGGNERWMGAAACP